MLSTALNFKYFFKLNNFREHFVFSKYLFGTTAQTYWVSQLILIFFVFASLAPSSPVHNRRMLSARNARMSSVELPDENEKSVSSASTSPCHSPVSYKHTASSKGSGLFESEAPPLSLLFGWDWRQRWMQHQNNADR